MSTEKTMIVALIAASATLGAAIIAAYAAYLSGRRERRRVLYGEAFKVAMSWQEMLYRVRRRRKGDEGTLIDRFHELQDGLGYYQGWIQSESRYMGRSYKRLVEAVKAKTEAPIKAAWAGKIRPVAEQARVDDMHPDISMEAELFLKDVRSYLSPIYIRKVAVVFRNRKWFRR